jgi:Ca2+-binding EF-hand superfamily protein
MFGMRLRSSVLLLTGCVLWQTVGPDAAFSQSTSPTADERFDVLFLAADAPLWLRIRLEGARDSLHAVRQRYARMMIQSVDTDGDGLANSAEAARLPARGRLGSSQPLLGENWKEFDTSPADGQLSADEYLSAVEAHLGGVFIIRRKPPQLVQSVQLLPRLDRDGDGKISASEILNGPQTLAAFDFDDDGTFSPAELQPFPQAMLDAAMTGGPDAQPEPFLVRDESTDRSGLISILYEKYAVGLGISLGQSGLSEFAFEAADSDGNGWLDETESDELLRPRAAVEIAVNIAAGQVRIGRLPRGSGRVIQLPLEHPRRLALQLSAEAVEFSAHDNRYAASDQINLLKIRFLQGDTDKNGYMGEQEFASLNGLEAGFADVDVDGDGKVFMDELERFLRIESYLAQCSLEMEFEPVEKPLFALLDENLDRRITAREFAVAAERLQEFDQNGDGVLDARELDLLSRFRVKFAFAVPPAVRPEQNTAMISQRRMPVIGSTSRPGPTWFLNMDRNRDGEVTWREFLGPREAFERLDIDGSEWIDAAEAEQAGVSE